MSDKTIHMLIGARVEMKRLKMGLTLVQFSRRIGMFSTVYENIENGTKKISIKDLYDICDKLGCEVSEFMPMVREVVPIQKGGYNEIN